jgi:hypothetical protein
MGEPADRLDGMVIEATSQDGHITAHVRGPGETIGITFRRHAYHRYGEGALADQLGRLATLAFVRIAPVWPRPCRASPVRQPT